MTGLPDDVTLDMLRSMGQLLLEGQATQREETRALRMRLSRLEHRMSSLEHAVLGLQGSATDRVDVETAIQDHLDTLLDRVERLERRGKA